MGRIDFMILEDGNASWASLSESLSEDQAELNSVNSREHGPSVAHVTLHFDDIDEGAAVSVLSCLHYLDEESEFSIVEKLVAAVFQAGIDHGRQQANDQLKVSDV